MSYNNGDLLLFKGISGNYANIITDVPTSDKTITFSFASCTDGDNNNYATLHIGTQIWMFENLKTTRYKDNTPIPIIVDNNDWNILTTAARCYYNNDSATYSSTYGCIYNWHAVNTGNLCPTGWHVPTDAEWTVLENYLGGDSVAGGKLKEAGTLHWLSPNTGASNETGYTALPGGCRIYNGNFILNGSNGFWWSSSEIDTNNAWYRGLVYDNNIFYNYNLNNNNGFSVRCIKDIGTQVSIPIINTKTASLITSSTATSGGNVISDGGSTVTERGVCWATNPNPTIADTHITNGNGIGSFTCNLTGLVPNTTYYIRAYATNSMGTAYGGLIVFQTLETSLVTDYDGNIYDTVHIGAQIWLKQNLKTTNYNNGIPIPNVSNAAIWAGLSTGARCYYNNDSSAYSATYGALYNWYAVNNGNICPTGWHVPSDSNWIDLQNYLGGHLVAGGKLKEIGNIHWTSPNIGATNETGFTALPGGYITYGGTYHDIGDYGYWWSSTQFNSSFAWFMSLYHNDSELDIDNYKKHGGFSVRCIKD